MRVLTTSANLGSSVTPVCLDGPSKSTSSSSGSTSKNNTSTGVEMDYSSYPDDSSSYSNVSGTAGGKLKQYLSTNVDKTVGADAKEKSWWDYLADIGNVAMYGDLAYSGMNNNDPYTQTMNASVTWGFLDVLENVWDGMLMLGSSMAVTEQYSIAANSWFYTEELFNQAQQNEKIIKESTAELVKNDWSEEGYAKTVNALGIDEEIAYGDVHKVGTAVGQIGGNIALGLVGGPGVQAALGGFQAYGSTAETALNSGATYDEANAAGLGSGILGATAGYGMDVLADTAKGASSVLEAVGYTGGGVFIGSVEPWLAAKIEYNTYAKNMVDENGNKIYNNFSDYYQQSGGPLNSFIGGSTGAIRVGSASVSGLINYKGVKDNYISAVVDKKTADYRWDTAKQIFEDEFGDGSWWTKLDDNGRNKKISELVIDEDTLSLKQIEYRRIAEETIATIEDLKANGKIKHDYSSADVLSMIQSDVPQETYLSVEAVNDWRQSWAPDANGNVEVYCFQDSSNSYALKEGVVGRPVSDSKVTYINPAGDGGAFVMTKQKYEEIINNPEIFQNGVCIDMDKLTIELGGVKFKGAPVAVKQVVPASFVEMPMGNNQGSFLGEWRPGGKTSGGVIEGVVPQNFTNTSTKGKIIPGTSIDIKIFDIAK